MNLLTVICQAILLPLVTWISVDIISVKLSLIVQYKEIILSACYDILVVVSVNLIAEVCCMHFTKSLKTSF